MEQPGVDSDLVGRFAAAMNPQEAPAEEEASQPVVENEQPQVEEVASEEDQATEDDGLVELETEDGEVLKVPPKLKDGYLRQSDYTRKTQEVAMLQKQATEALQQQALIAQFQEHTKEDQQRLNQIQAELQRFKALDWANLDTETYIKTRGYMDQLKDQAADLEQALGKKASEFQRHVQERDAMAARTAYELIQRHVKDWTPDSQTEKDIARYAQGFGVPPEALGKVAKLFPGFAVMAYKAAQFDNLQAGKAVKSVQKAPPVVKPGAVTNTNTVAQQKYQKVRETLKKNPNSLDAAAAVFLQRGIK